MKEQKQTNKIYLNYKIPELNELQTIKDSFEAMSFLHLNINADIAALKMSCYLLLLTSDDKLLGFSELSFNQSNGFDVNYRELFQLSLLANARKIIIVHNDPNNYMVDKDVNISQQEIENIQSLKKYLERVDISLKDYLIFNFIGFASAKFAKYI